MSVLSEKELFKISIVIVTYFLMIYIADRFEINYVIIDVIRELMTIPFLISQIIFLFVGAYFLKERKASGKKYLVILSMIILGASSIITIGSFFV